MNPPLYKKNQVVMLNSGGAVQIRTVRGDDERDSRGRVVYDVQGLAGGFMAVETEMRALTSEEKGE